MGLSNALFKASYMPRQDLARMGRHNLSRVQGFSWARVGRETIDIYRRARIAAYAAKTVWAK